MSTGHSRFTRFSTLRGNLVEFVVCTRIVFFIYHVHHFSCFILVGCLGMMGLRITKLRRLIGFKFKLNSQFLKFIMRNLINLDQSTV
jgi:hypothetical protein